MKNFLSMIAAGIMMFSAVTSEAQTSFSSLVIKNGANSVTINPPASGTPTFTFPSTSGEVLINPMAAFGDLLYGDADGDPTALTNNAGFANYLLQSNGVAAPSWTNSLYVSSVTASDIDMPADGAREIAILTNDDGVGDDLTVTAGIGGAGAGGTLILRSGFGSTAATAGISFHTDDGTTLDEKMSLSGTGNLAVDGSVGVGTALGAAGTPTAGTTYSDNIVRGWANVNADAGAPSIRGEFGMLSLARTSAGVYTIDLATAVASTNTAAVLVTLQEEGESAVAVMTDTNTITVTLEDDGGNPADLDFYIQVIGR